MGNCGVRSIRVRAQGFLFHPGTTGQEKTGRANSSEPSMKSRHRHLRRWDVVAEEQDWPLGRRRVPRRLGAGAGEHHCPGIKRASTPVVSHTRGTWQPRLGSRRFAASGKSTARKAQLPSGNKMVQEANAGGRKEAGNRETTVGSSAGVFCITDRIRADARSRKGADVDQVSC